MALTKKVKIILFLLLFVSCHENEPNTKADFLYENSKIGIEVSKDSTELIANLGLVYYNNEPFTGTTTRFHRNGTLVETVSYIRGKRDGPFKKWFHDGTLSFKSINKNGRQEGVSRSWWSNGNLRSESYFEKGIAHGLQKQWYKSGAKFKEIQLIQGKEVGMQRSWRENGKLYNNYEVVKGRIFGLKRSKLCFQLDDENLIVN